MFTEAIFTLIEVILVLTTFGFLDPPELILFLIIALVIFGPGKLPELGKSLGKGISEFKAATSGEPEKKKEPSSEPGKKKEANAEPEKTEDAISK